MSAGTEVSVGTVRRILNTEGLHARTPKMYNTTDPKAYHNHMPQKFWNNVLRSDETKLELFSLLISGYVWRKKNEAHAEKNTLPTVKHGLAQ